jgi:hypothetical protein
MGRKLLQGIRKMVPYLESIAALVVAGVLPAACTSETDVDAEAEAAQSVVDMFWRAIGDEDADLLSRVVANG